MKERAPEDRIGVPVPNSGIPREWVDAARENLKNNRRPANAGRRDWELSGGALRCAECGRAMSARSYSKRSSARTYFYYCCSAGGYNKPRICSARTHHKAEALETQVWDAVSKILKEPARLRAGLDHMIEQERRGTHGDPVVETERWLGQISETNQKRARYQEMAAEGLINFEELRAQLSALEETRNTAERELQALKNRTERLEQLERDKGSLLRSYSGLMPKAIDTLSSEERHRVYKMIRMKAYLEADGSLELSGDVMSFSSSEISSS